MLWLLYWYITDFWIVWYSLLLFSLQVLKESLVITSTGEKELLTAGILMLPGILPFALVCLAAVLSGEISGYPEQLELLFSLYSCPPSLCSLHNWVISLSLPTCPPKLKKLYLPPMGGTKGFYLFTVFLVPQDSFVEPFGILHDAALQVGVLQEKSRGAESPPRSAGHTALDAAQDTVGFL